MNSWRAPSPGIQAMLEFRPLPAGGARRRASASLDASVTSSSIKRLRLAPERLGALAGLLGLARSLGCLPSLRQERMQWLARAGADVVVEERQHELEADQKRQCRDHDGAGRHQLIRRRRDPVIEPERQAEQE